MKGEPGKFGVWLSQSEMALIQDSLEWQENCYYHFKRNSKIASIKNLRNDLSKIQDKGPQMQKPVENLNEEYEDERMNNICEECE
jgi:hypothetical protein